MAVATLRANANAAAAAVGEALAQAGVHAILLKGPSLARALYTPPARRRYEDVDLLIEPLGDRRAAQALERIGYREAARTVGHHRVFLSPRHAPVELHRTLIGVGVRRERCWTLLQRNSEAASVRTCELRVLAPNALAVHVALHASQHAGHPKALDDLSRALQVWPWQCWLEAYALARQLGAVDSFGAGLRFLPAGSSLAERLGVPANRSLGVALRSGSLHRTIAAKPAIAAAEILAQPELAQKVLAIGRAALPAPEVIRTMYPDRGLIGAYLTRPARIAKGLPGAASAWGAAQREHRRRIREGRR